MDDPPARRVPVRTFNSLIVGPARRFRDLQASSGIVLIAAAAAALLWANLDSGSYNRFWANEIDIAAGSAWEYRETLGSFVNDALMTWFFFVVGLEIKREVRLGALRDKRAAAMPAIAALGGMIVPALIYLAFNPTGDAASGWGIPVATDITFALGVIALLGRSLPSGARLFLLALALADDIGAILVIAIFYTTDLSFGWLVGALAALAAVYVAKHSGIRSMVFYWAIGLTVWYATFRSGIHPTLAGVALGFLTPTSPLHMGREFRETSHELETRYADGVQDANREQRDDAALSLSNLAREAVSPLHRLSRALHPWTAFVVAPAFALANAGIIFGAMDLGEVATSSVAVGVAAGLVIGKTVGILSASWLAVRMRVARLPDGVGWGHICGLAILGGTGFTVSLFITDLAFTDPTLTDLSKVGILVGSVISAIAGYVLLRGIARRG